VLLGVGNARLGSTTAVVIVAQAAIVITALAMVARGLAGMVTLITGAIAVDATLAATLPTAVATTFGIRGADRRDIGRQQCRCAERQGTSKDG